MVKRIVAYATGTLFVAAGVAHLLHPGLFEEIVPPGWGDARFDVVVSGVAEIAGGIGLMTPRFRGSAGYGLVALLLAVWPANWYMALHASRYAALASPALLWLRVPLQLPMIALVLWLRS